MPWGLWSYPPPSGGTDDASSASKTNSNKTSTPTIGPRSNATMARVEPPPPPPPPRQHAPIDLMYPEKPTDKKRPISWNDSLNRLDWQHFTEARTIIPSGLVIFFAFGFYAFYQSYLRRFPKTGHIDEKFFRRRNLLGKVTSVGDGDGFRLFHTPGGRLAGWGWLRKVPTGRKELIGRTISVRLAGVDAPETAHFGRPAQPFSAEALNFLREYLLGKRVRAHIYRKDQYERVVATVYVRKPPFFLKKDVGLEMLKQGLATTYEAKTGAEFGGDKVKAVYMATEAAARKKGKGLWAAEAGGFFGLGKKKDIESPRAFKDRMKVMGEGNGDSKVSNGRFTK